MHAPACSCTHRTAAACGRTRAATAVSRANEHVNLTLISAFICVFEKFRRPSSAVLFLHFSPPFSLAVVADKSPDLNPGSDKNSKKSRAVGKVQSETLSTRFQKSYFRANHLWRRADGYPQPSRALCNWLCFYLACLNMGVNVHS